MAPAGGRCGRQGNPAAPERTEHVHGHGSPDAAAFHHRWPEHGRSVPVEHGLRPGIGRSRHPGVHRRPAERLSGGCGTTLSGALFRVRDVRVPQARFPCPGGGTHRPGLPGHQDSRRPAPASGRPRPTGQSRDDGDVQTDGGPGSDPARGTGRRRPASS